MPGWTRVGNVYYRQQDFDRTLELLDEMMTMRREVLGDGSPAVARTLNTMGMVYTACGRGDTTKEVVAVANGPLGLGGSYFLSL